MRGEPRRRRLSLARLLAVAVKEVRQMRRDRITIFLLSGMPAAMLCLFGYALTLDVDHIPLGIADLDRTAESRDLVARFTSAATFVPVAEARDAAGLERLLDRGAIRAGLVIPPGFQRDLKDLAGAQAQLLIDGADSNTARIAQGYAIVIARTRGNTALVGAFGPSADPVNPVIETRPTVWFNPELRSANFVIPGLLGIMLLISTILMTAMSVVRERERGTLEALVASPVQSLELILGKTVPYIVIAYADVLISLGVATVVFDVPFRGSIGVFVGVIAVFVVGALGFGLLISTIANSQQEAWTLGLLTTLLPSFLLSGFVFPIENMEPWVQAITTVIPARYFISALRAVILKGVGFEAIAPEMQALAIFAVVLPALAAARFRKRLG